MKTLNTLVNATLEIEKLRVASEVRQSHLKLKGRVDPDTDWLHDQLVGVENNINKRIADLLKEHPAYSWFSRVKGIGKENIGKVIGLIRVEPEVDGEGKELPYADTISALWQFAGFGVDNGKAPKRKSGEKLSYNSQLRSMVWRVGTSLLKSKGKFYEYYLAQKERLILRYQNEGIKIVPAIQLPKIDGKKQEGGGYISEGHIHNMALRKMNKLFLSCLFLEWRRGLGLPYKSPYAIDILKHKSFIKPEEMTDR